ncbi:hypothetical protein HPB51_018997 [Rhipicephalus microplus]|uniref:Uncharacterized protein n=1 Tax=Rhipicephalus microplus TaxID=6941 RepID=A0A9J6D665_RHIMP|nr:hypothetical protein HPB51_018997 [Rhipicephalus microplus]
MPCSYKHISSIESVGYHADVRNSHATLQLTVQANELDIWWSLSRPSPLLFLIQGSAGRPFFDQAFLKFGSSGAKIVHFWGSEKPWAQVYDWSKSQVHPSPDSPHRPEHLQMWCVCRQLRTSVAPN